MFEVQSRPSTTRKTKPSKIFKQPPVTSQETQAFIDRYKIVNPKSITTTEAAAYLSEVHGIRTAPKSLEVYRCRGKSPKYKKIGSRVFYTLSWLDDYAKGVEIKIYDPSTGTEEIAE